MFSKPLLCSKEEYLNTETSIATKGLLAIGVLLAHTIPAANVLKIELLQSLFGFLGYLCVAGFFFLSGYGITAQYYIKKENYLKTFLKNRVLSIYFLTLFLILLYALFRILVNVPIKIIDLFQSFLVGNTIVSNGWYLQIVLLFYLLWYVTTKHIKKKTVQLTVQLIAITVYVVVGFLALDRFWYESCFAFVLGVFWRNYKDKIDEWLFSKKTRVFIVSIISIILFAITFLLASRQFVTKIDTLCVGLMSMPKGLLINTILNPYMRSVMACISSVFFVIFILMFNIIFGKFINCKPLKFLGSFSLEIYVLQGIPLHIFANGILKIENGWLFIICVVVSTLLLAVVLHPLIKLITNIPKKYFNRGVI